MPISSTDILLVTALELEHKAILKQFNNLHDFTIDSFQLHIGEINGTKLSVTCFQRMGNVNSAASTAKLLHLLRPRLVLLIGIAGGTARPISDAFSAQDHFLGDVLIAEQVVDYESGKLSVLKLENRFRVYPGSSSALAIAKNLRPDEWVGRIGASRPDGTTGRTNPQAHFGTFASGEKVIKSEEFVSNLKSIWTQTVAVEMESLGVAVACFQTSPPTEFLVIKAVCDWADPAKNDLWQQYSAEAASAFSLALIMKLQFKAIVGNASVTSQRQKSIDNAKLRFVQCLGSSWKDLSDALQIPLFERERFERGDEPRAIWEWLETRGRLNDLTDAFKLINREDLKDVLSNPR
jgi:nucleoside phosphorylase